MRKNLYALLFLLVLPLAVLGQSITFSATRGFYESPFQLALSTSLAGATIRYTTDGSAPTATTGTVYAGTIPVTTTSVIRAIGYSGTGTTAVATHSYLFLNDVIHQPKTIAGWPNHDYALGSGTATATHDYEMDPKVVNDPAYSGVVKTGLTSIPTMSLVLNKDDFWDLYEGETTHPTSVEVFYPDGAKEQFNCDLEPHSHNRLKRSLSLSFNSSVTTNLLKKAPFNGGSVATTFKDTKLVLRAGNNRSWARNWNPDRTCYTRDEWYRESQQAISGVGGRGTFVHLYINGLYWGLYNPAERTDAGMLANYYGGDYADWMAMDPDGIRSGDPTRYNYLTSTLINQDLTVPANYAQLKQYLDVSRFCDYLIVTWMTGMTDWPGNNFHGAARNVPPGPFWYNTWDCEWSWDVTNGSNQGAWVHPEFRNDQTGTATLAKIWHAARRNSEFMQLFADRVYRNCFNGGGLTDAASRARWAQVNDFIKTAIVDESARWGDALQDGVTRTRDGYWTPEVNRVDGLMNGNVNRFIAALVAQGYYPTLPAPGFSQEGGTVASGFQLTITNPSASGTIYYTTDGSDPEAAGGAVAPGAIAYTGPVAITGSQTVRARVQSGGTWSPLHEASFTISGLITGLHINEFIASNTRKADEFGEFDDWIEIYNSGSQPVNIAGLYVTDILTNLTQCQIPATNATLTTIPAKGYLLLWADGQPAQGPLHINLKLSKSGEAIGLSQMVGSTATALDSYTFGAQTDDVSVGRYPDGSSTFRPFFAPTPGSSNIITFKANLFINELLAVNQSSITDEAGEHDGWIEVYNNNSEAVNIGGLYLTNTLANPSFYKIPTTNAAQTTIPAKGFLTLWADNQPAQGALHVGFTLNAGGGQIGLADILGPDVSLIDSTRYGGQTANVSRGRYPDASKQFKSLAAPTPGATNTAPAITGLFINEFMASNTKYADEFGEFDDWIELYNDGTQAVDVGGLYITDDLNTTNKYQIPTTNPALTTIPAKGFLLLWADDQATQGVLHVGFKLSASGEQLGLFQPNGTATTALDTYTFAAQTADVSSGREQDGAANFVSFAQPTPKASNKVTPPNSAPAANAGPNQTITLPTNSVTLTGTGTDDGTITGYAWTQVSGPSAATLSGAATATLTAGGLVAGSYVFSLVVTDNGGLSSTPSQVTITVNSAPSGPLYAVYRLNAGGGQVTNSIGTFAADNYFSGGSPFSTSAAIAGTSNGAMYQTERNGTFGYALPVSNGSYTVVLHFAELYWTSAGQRLFDVALEGTKVLQKYDIVKKVGPLTATTETFPVTVTDGILNLSFIPAGVDLPKVSAIEVLSSAATNTPPTASAGPNQTITLPASSVSLSGTGSGTNGSTITAYTWTQSSGPSTAAFSSKSVAAPTVSGLGAGSYVFSLVVTDNGGLSSAPSQVTITVNPATTGTVAYRINAGGGQVTNSLGTFAADNYFSGGSPFSTSAAIAGTSNGALYQTERYGTNGQMSYAFPVSNGSYTVVLHFAEVYWTQSGRRVFDVSLENAKVLTAYDIYKKVGAFTATTETFPVTVTDGVLNVSFSSLNAGGADQPKVSAIEVLSSSTTSSPPTASAGANQTLTLPASSTSLSGTGTAASGRTITGYTWSQVSGPSTAAFSSKSVAAPTVSGLGAGSYVFSLVVTDNGGLSSAASTVTITVNPATTSGPQVVSFTLINADTEQPIRDLVGGDVLNLASLPTRNLNVRANTNPATVGSVVFALSGAQTQNQTETSPPYALFGDVNGNYNAWTPALGSYSLKATPYVGAAGSGTAGTPLTLSFTVTNQAARTAATPTVHQAAGTSEPFSAPLAAYPNPTGGQFSVALPAALHGEVSYVLLSETGATLAKGKRTVPELATELPFDFSEQMRAVGVYYLHLKGKSLKVYVKLERP